MQMFDSSNGWAASHLFASSFFDFLEAKKDLETDGGLEGCCLTDILEQWIILGDAIDQCGGDFSLFLTAVLLIADELHRSPETFGNWAKLITGGLVATDPDCPLPQCMDLHQWNRLVFMRKYGHRVYDNEEHGYVTRLY